MDKLRYAAAYIRVSTDDQLEFSLDAQLMEINKFCVNNGYKLLSEHIYSDEGISGKTAKSRPAFQKMISMAKIKPKPFDIIVVHKFDRFARSREDSVVYKSLLKRECGIKVISMTENIEDDKFSVILEAMLEAMAEYYSLNLAEEVKKGMTQKAIKGQPQAAAPFGYKMIDNKLIEIPIEAKIIKQIYSYYLQGESFRDIAKNLNNIGILTHRGNNFEARTIEYILRNPAYIGKLRWNPTEKTNLNYNHPDIIISDGQHKQIISEKMFQDVQSKIIKNKKTFGPNKNTSSKNLSHWLSGIIICSRCGATLIKQNSSFQCSNYLKGKCTKSTSISIKKAENAILSQISNDIDQTKFTDLKITFTETESENQLYNSLIIQKNKLKTRLKRCKIAYENGIDSLDEYKTSKNSIIEELNDIEEEIAKSEYNENNHILNTNSYGNLKSIHEYLIDENFTNTQKSKALKSIIHKIIFDRDNNTFTINYYLENSL